MVAHTCNPSTWQMEADGSECQDLRLLTSSLCLRFSWASLPSTQDQNQVEESQVHEMQLHGVITLKPRSSGTAFENEEVLKPYSVAVLVSTSFWNVTAPPAAVLTLLFKAQARALSTYMCVLVPCPFLPASGSSTLRNCPSSFQCVSRRAAEYRVQTSRTVSTKQLLEQLFPGMSELTPRGTVFCILGWKHKLVLMLWSYHGSQEDASQEETSLECGTGLQPVNPGKAASGAS